MRDIAINLIASFLFALIVNSFRESRGRATSDPVEYIPRTHDDPSIPQRRGSSGEPSSASRKQGFDAFSFLWLLGLSVTVVVPFLLGGIVLAIIDITSNGTSSFITDQMRRNGQSGYVQYWLGSSILTTIEIAILLLRPWRGRIFGVSLGIALGILLVVFGIPASRGESLF